MISEKQLEETEQRFAARTTERESTIRKIESGPISKVDTEERVKMRVERLASQADMPMDAFIEAHVPGLAEAAPMPGPAAVEDLTELGQERILEQSDLMPINYLELGLKVARTVGRIVIRAASGRVVGYGSGFMVSPRLLLTNNHVLGGSDDAEASQVEFNYQIGLDREPLSTATFDLDPGAFFLTDQQLDYTLVAVERSPREGQSLSEFGWNSLIEDQGKIVLGEYVNIIQHPNGEAKQIALRENRVVDRLDDFLHYKTDTAPGSSGSPVYNDEWEVVALHHSGVPKRDEQRRILTRDNRVWTQDMGEQAVDWIANEGARTSRIIADARSQGQNLPQAQRRVLDEMLNSSEENKPLDATQRVSKPTRLSDEKPEALAPTSDSGVEVQAGTATWTIPIQVSIRLGEPTPSGAPTQGGYAKVETRSGAGVRVKATQREESRELQEALDDLERGRAREYYNEAQDHEALDDYYDGLPGSLTPAKLFSRLSSLLEETHKTKPRYAPSREVYPWVDLQESGMLRSVYSAKQYDPAEFIREDFEVEQERQRRQERLVTESHGVLSAEAMLDILEAGLPYNCEHVVPQSWFQKKEPMRGDLHHLFACESGCNSFRGNIPYFDFPDFEEARREACGQRIGDNKFEPTAGKGTVARATLYFLLRYPGEIDEVEDKFDEDRIGMLLGWHHDHPATIYERHRNMAIFEKQGNRNPLIDFPDWASKIDFRRGLG